jgi:hypothetical protein
LELVFGLTTYQLDAMDRPCAVVDDDGDNFCAIQMEIDSNGKEHGHSKKQPCHVHL